MNGSLAVHSASDQPEVLPPAASAAGPALAGGPKACVKLPAPQSCCGTAPPSGSVTLRLVLAWR